MFLWSNMENYPKIILEYPPYLFPCNLPQSLSEEAGNYRPTRLDNAYTLLKMLKKKKKKKNSLETQTSQQSFSAHN